MKNNLVNLSELGTLFLTNGDFTSSYGAYYVCMRERLTPGPIPAYIWTRVNDLVNITA